MSIKDRFIKTICSFDKELIFVYDDKKKLEYTYEAFAAKCMALASKLEETEGQKVVAVFENSVELVELYLACILTDKTVVVVDPQKGEAEIHAIVSSLTDYTVLTPEFFEAADANIKPFDTKGFMERLEKRDFTKQYLITFTSGTSGNTKGVSHSIETLLGSAFALADKVGIKERGCLLHVMPMTYMAGILNSILYPLVYGASIVVGDRFSVINARFFWSRVEKYQANLFWLSPAMLMMIDQMDKLAKGKAYCDTHETLFLIGTAALTSKTRDAFNSKYGVSVYASYGLSETLFVSVETPESLKTSKGDSVGDLLDGVEYQMSESGEFLIRVPWMFLGYTNENTSEYFAGDYYKSGDALSIEDGNAYVVGRVKELIVKGGMNISPALMEKVILTVPAVVECAVIGVKDSDGEEKICCVYVSEDNEASTEEEISSTVRRELGKNYMIDYFMKQKAMVRNINGKLDKNKMREIWENEFKK